VQTLLLSIEELGMLPPSEMLGGAGNLAFLGPWLLFAPLVAWWRRGRPGVRALATARADHLLLASLLLAFLGLTVLLSRTKVLLAPLVAIAVAGLLTDAGAPPARAASRAPRDREARRRPGPSPGHAFLLVLFAGTLVGNAAVSASLAMTRSSRIEPEF